MPIYLLAAVPVFLALAVLVGIALLHQLRREKAFAARVALAHGETPTGEEGAEGAALRTWLTKAVTAIGQAILRTGMLSSRTRTELERTLDACGLRGPNGLEGLIQKRQQVREFEAGNEQMRREIEQKQTRIQRLQSDPQEQEIEIRQRLKLAAPGEKIYIIDDRKK